MSNMKSLVVIFGLVALAGAFKIGTKKTQLIKVAKRIECGSDETPCSGGCCPEANWYYCPDNFHCSPTPADCPSEAKKNQLMKLAKRIQCDDGVWCPGGCCPMPDWFCCPDALYCHPTAADCPFEAKKTQLVELELAKSGECDGVWCPNGLCCWYPAGSCCDNMCSPFPAECP